MLWQIRNHDQGALAPTAARPRVAFFLASLRCGGAERMTVNLLDALVGQGVPVDLVLAKAEGELLSEVPPQVRLFDLGQRRMRHALGGLVRYFRRERPFGLISRVDHANVLAALAATVSRTQTRLVVTAASRFLARVEATADNPLSAYLRRRSAVPVIRWAYRRADAVVAVSQGVADELSQELGLASDSIRVIRNPVVTREIDALAVAESQHPWLADGGTPVILSVGRLVWEKDHAALLCAFAFLLQKRPARLIILGEGPLRRSLEELRRALGLEGVCAMPGYCANPYAAMARADLFVLSSHSEGSPNVLAEALACGCPIVSTDCQSGPAEVLAGGQFGLLTPVGDSLALASAMHRALGKAWDRDALRQRAADYSNRASARRYLDALGYPLDLLDGRGEASAAQDPGKHGTADSLRGAA